MPIYSLNQQPPIFPTIESAGTSSFQAPYGNTPDNYSLARIKWGDNILRAFFDKITNSKSFKYIENFVIEEAYFLKDATDYLRNINNYATYESQKLDKNFDNILFYNNLRNDVYFAKETGSDGNCWYRSVSYLLTYSEDNYYVIKLLCFFIFFQYRDFFTLYLIEAEYGFSFDQMIIHHLVLNQWADDLIKIATAFLLDRTIYSFATQISKTKKISLVPHCLRYTVNDGNQKRPIY